MTLVTRWKQAKAARASEMGYPVLSLPPSAKLKSKPFVAVGPRMPTALGVGFHQIRQSFDIWHVHWLYPTCWMAAPALNALRVPFVATAHGADIHIEHETGYGFRQFDIHDRRVRKFAPKLQHVTAISSEIAIEFQNLGIPEAGIQRISNGVNFNRLNGAIANRDQTRRKLGISVDAPVVLSVGRNEPRKGLTFIPEMLDDLLKIIPNLKWLVIGKDSDKLMDKIAPANKDAVILRAPIRASNPMDDLPPEELADLFGCADLFVTPSLSEGLPLVLLEAMASGLPVVGFDSPGVREIVNHQEDGLLCEPRNTPAMARNIATLLTDAAERQRLSASATRKAKAHDWSQISQQYLTVYSDIIRNRNAR